jgi:two-component system NarL family response regulator
MGKIRILMVDDHNVVRQGIRSLLDLEPDLQVVAEASSGNEALQLINTVHPDVVLLDLKMTDISGAEVCWQMTASHPDLPILILTAISDDQNIWECICAGAKGYVLKDVDVQELARTIRIVHNGQAVLDPRITRVIMQHVRHAPESLASTQTLTPQELDIARLIAKGLTNREIGQQLFLSPNTVKFHISNIMRKLNVKRRVELVSKAVGGNSL